MDRRAYLASLGLLFGAGCSGGGSEAPASQRPVRQLGEAYALPDDVRIRVREAVVAERVVHDDAFGEREALVSGEDHEFLLVEVEATNLKPETQPLPTARAYRVLAADGEAIQRLPTVHDDGIRLYEPVSGTYLGLQWVESGGTVSGWMRFAIPADREVGYLALDPGMQYGDLRVRWELGPSLGLASVRRGPRVM